MKHFLLISLQTQGFLWLLFLFGFCFSGVHVAKLAGTGWEHSKAAANPPAANEPKAPPAPQEKKPLPQQEPIYYIVERKKRKKPTYGEPKKISFPPPENEKREQ